MERRESRSAEDGGHLVRRLRGVVESLREVEDGRLGELDARILEHVSAARRHAELAAGSAARPGDGRAAPVKAPAEAGERALPLVLLVEDDPVMTAYLREHLRSGYRLAEASGGEEALRLARELLPDLIVSDVMMPGMDGYALCHELRQDPELDFIPLILLTGKTTPESRVTGFQEGADGWLSKPVDFAELRARIDNLIVSRRRLLERFRRSTEAPAAPGLPIAEGVRIDDEDRGFLGRVERLLDEHLEDQDFSVDALAAGLAMDRTHLFRRLRELTGFTPSALIRELRLGTAAQRLAGSDDTVAEIAWSVGFKDVSHFTKLFRRRYRVTPAAFRDRSATP